MEACTLAHIGDTHLAMGAPEEAETSWRQALALFASLGHPDAEQVREQLLAARGGRRDLA